MVCKFCLNGGEFGKDIVKVSVKINGVCLCIFFGVIVCGRCYKYFKY